MVPRRGIEPPHRPPDILLKVNGFTVHRREIEALKMAVPARIERAFREPESRVLTVGRRDFYGAPDGTRTHDLLHGKQTLYQLSYWRVGKMVRPAGLAIFRVRVGFSTIKLWTH